MLLIILTDNILAIKSGGSTLNGKLGRLLGRKFYKLVS